MLLSHIFLSRREIRASQIVLRGSFVERLHGNHGAVFANRALEIILREPQIAEMPVQLFVNRKNIIEAVERGGSVRGLAEFLFERSQLLPRLRIASAHLFVISQDSDSGLFISLCQIRLRHEL